MTKAQFVSKVAAKSGLSQKDTNEMLDAAIETLSQALIEKDNLSFVGFGSFSTVEKAARDVRIPSSGKIIHVPAKTAVKFKVGKALKEAVE